MRNRIAWRSRTSVGSRLMPRLVAILSLLLVVGFIDANDSLKADTVEFVTGAKMEGSVVSRTDKYVLLNIKVGSRTVSRRYPIDRIRALTINGNREVLSNGGSQASSQTGSRQNGNQRTRAEVRRLIDNVGSTPPDWYQSTPLNYPETLDLTWPMPPPKPWNNKKNVGQFKWDIINPNPGRWREGVKFFHHLLVVNKDNRDVQRRAMQALGQIYYGLLEDYVRAAFWWEKGEVDKRPDAPQNAVHLAECYWRLGNRDMALDLMKKIRPQHIAMIKLIADMGETDTALKMAETAKNTGLEHFAYMYAGDACRLAGRFDDAINYYQRVLKIPASGQRSRQIEQHHKRAEASLAAIRLFDTLDINRVPDGAYRASSLGYEGQVEVEVVMRDHRIQTVKVTDHKEKQFYSSIADTTRDIVAKQGVRGVDATSSATITSEAIINATAKALSAAMQ